MQEERANFFAEIRRKPRRSGTRPGAPCIRIPAYGIIIKSLKRKVTRLERIRRWLARPRPGYADAAVLVILAAGAFLLWNHPDIQETARHTRILLEDLFSGRFFDFYNDTMAGREIYGYANAAHYHIVFYLLCALWDLPVYLLSLFLPVSDFAFVLWTKLLGVGAWAVSGLLLGKLAGKMGSPDDDAAWVPYAFWLCPIAFFTVLAMGQYDSLCLVFLLWALLLYWDGRMPAFCLVIGAAMVFKMFALFIAIPLLLLREKRVLRLIGYGVLCLWLYLPGVLLFRGRDGDAGFFNGLIADRLFVQRLGVEAAPSLVLTLLAVLYMICWAWRPADERSLRDKSPYVCMAAFAVLFLCVEWHPQWLILITPFLILTTLSSRHRLWWLVLQIIFTASFFVLVFYRFPAQLECNLFDFGVLGEWAGLLVSGAETMRTNTIYFDLLPYAKELAAVGFAAPLLLSLAGKFPLRGVQLADRLDRGEAVCVWPSASVWLPFIAAFGVFWFVPTAFAWLKSLAILS